MQERYRAAIRNIDTKTKFLILRKLRLPCRKYQSLFDALASQDQAALVMCLLHLNIKVARKYVEKLVGKPITICPSGMPKPFPIHIKDMTGDHRRIVFVSPEPLLKSGRKPWARAWQRVRLGLSVIQLKKRGVSRRLLRVYEKRGWIKLEGKEAGQRMAARYAAATRK